MRGQDRPRRPAPALRRRLLRLVAIAVMLSPWAAAWQPARAQSLALSCTIAISTFAFGSFDVLPGASVTTNATLSVTCLNVTATTGNLYLCLAIPRRAMAGSSPGRVLAYDILGPPTATTSWSDTTPILVPFAQLDYTPSYTLTLQGVVMGSQQPVPPDSYGQALTATATYGSFSCTSGLNSSALVSFQASATVAKSCNVTAGNLSFGTVTSLAGTVDGRSALTVQCSNGTGYTVGLDGGLSGATDPTARRMTGPDGSITYGLYQDAARSTPWSASQTVGGTGTSLTQAIPVYGRVPPQATPAPGTYSDTVVVTVTY